MKLNEDISNKLFEARRKKRMKSSVVAEALGVSRSYISAIENNRGSISLERLKALADLYNQKVDYFITSTNENSQHNDKIDLPINDKTIIDNKINDINEEYKTKKFNIENIAEFLIKLFGDAAAGELAALIMEKIGSSLSNKQED